MRRRRGPLAKVKLKMPVAVRSPPAEAEQGPRGGPFRRCISASPASPLPVLFPGTCGAEARSQWPGCCRSVLHEGGRWWRGMPELRALGVRVEPSRAVPGWAGARISDCGHKSGHRLEINCKTLRGEFYPAFSKSFPNGVWLNKHFALLPAPSLPCPVMIDIFYSANFYLPCKNVGDKCDKLQICKFL